jgi:hypothetical protein
LQDETRRILQSHAYRIRIKLIKSHRRRNASCRWLRLLDHRKDKSIPFIRFKLNRLLVNVRLPMIPIINRRPLPPVRACVVGCLDVNDQSHRVDNRIRFRLEFMTEQIEFKGHFDPLRLRHDRGELGMIVKSLDASDRVLIFFKREDNLSFVVTLKNWLLFPRWWG